MVAIEMLVLAALAYRTIAQSSQLPFDPTVASAYACPSACQTNLAAGIKGDAAVFTNAPVRDASFFETAANFTTSTPGSLLKLQPIKNLTSYDFNHAIPAGTTLYAIQYVSVGYNQTKVPATGFIALPYIYEDSPASTGYHEKSKFPLVSLAHGTSGLLLNCAPTLSFNLYDYFSWTPAILRGFAVVATDYAGLGNNFARHPYIAARIHSNDVYYAAQAAQAAFPNLLTKRWGAVGHSQGGGTTYALTENELVRKDKNFIGSVAISPVGRVYDQLRFSGIGAPLPPGGQPPTAGSFGFLVLHTWGLQTAYPGINVTALLSDTFARRYALTEKFKLCLGAQLSLAGDLNPTQLFASETAEKQWFALMKKFQSTYGAGVGRPSYAPLLIVHSEGDSAVPYQVAQLAYNTSCAVGNEVELAQIPLLDHSATVGSTAGMWLSWLENRILQRNKGTSQKCSMHKPVPVDGAAAYAPLNSQG